MQSYLSLGKLNLSVIETFLVYTNRIKHVFRS